MASLQFILRYEAFIEKDDPFCFFIARDGKTWGLTTLVNHAHSFKRVIDGQRARDKINRQYTNLLKGEKAFLLRARRPDEPNSTYTLIGELT
jgi:hypothetical protein